MNAVERVMRPDPVNRPAHYNMGRIPVIDFIEDQKLPYHLGNVVKYICRSAHKGTEIQDLKKAQWYLNRWIENLESPSTPSSAKQESTE